VIGSDETVVLTDAMSDDHRQFFMETGTLPALLKELRSRLGLSPEKLASLLRVSAPTVNRWATGKTTPDPRGANAIEQFVTRVRDRHPDLHDRFPCRFDRRVEHGQFEVTNWYLIRVSLQ
jgi:transcriptional regulator with XRE-family HTH domain